MPGNELWLVQGLSLTSNTGPSLVPLTGSCFWSCDSVMERDVRASRRNAGTSLVPHTM